MTIRLARERAPRTDPPYDDELEAGRTWAIAGALALALPLELPRRPALALVADPRATDPRTGRDLTPSVLLPAVGPRAAQLVRAILEVLCGDRPARHLVRVATLDVIVDLEQQARSSSARPWARSVRSMRVCSPSSGIAEVAAVVDRGDRCGALALRLEGLDGRWVVTEIALP